jgi:two-component system chemotaxis response regulator CheY
MTVEMRRKRMKFLIVDDEATSRNMVATMLSTVADCDEAESGSDAIEKFRSAKEGDAPYDLIILDIVMPDMDGHATAKSIRSLEKEHGVPADKRVKIIMLTALNSPQDAMESLCNSQSAAYIVKPASRENLLGTINKLGLRKK